MIFRSMFLFLYCIVWCAEVVESCGMARSAVVCNDPAPIYTQRPTVTHVCDSSTSPHSSNNYCFRDDVAGMKLTSYLAEVLIESHSVHCVRCVQRFGTGDPLSSCLVAVQVLSRYFASGF